MMKDTTGKAKPAIADGTSPEHTKPEAAQEQNEILFQVVFKLSPDAIVLIDPHDPNVSWPIIDCNAAACMMSGYRREELIGHSVDILNVVPGTQVERSAYLERLRKAGHFKIEVEHRHKSGAMFPVEASTTLITTGKRELVIGIDRDITGRKQAETEMRQRLSELEVLYQSGLAFSQLIAPQAIAQKMIDLLDQKMDWHHTAIRLYHPESETLELLAFHLSHLNSREERSAAEERFKAMQSGRGLSGWAFQHGRVVRSNHLKRDPRYFETFPGLQSGLYVPIKIAERIVGVISIESERPRAFNESNERLVITLAAQAAIAMENAKLFEHLKLSNIELASAYDVTIEGWARALDLRDKETEGHSRRVTDKTLRLAQSMGLGGEELVHVRRGALLHDIGKLSVPDGVLLKPGPLTDEEWIVMRKHPTFSYEMLSPIRYLQPALDIPYCHHEKWDGSGYPRGLKGEQIPLAARIFTVVDVWDALNSDRPYRARWAEDKVREHIRASSGTHFDPQVVDVFMQMIQ
ncbi:MAG: HD domain-containing phosphohydrolase [Anaerolineales bacterium]